jgi:tRNA (cytidine/uridine-2'-O-)-methyltransferase
MQIALYEPDIPQNTGTIMRLCVCLDVPVHIIEPAGFDASDRALKRAGLDYLDHVHIVRHVSFATFEKWRQGENLRLILLTTKAKQLYVGFDYTESDILLLGRESSGVPEEVHRRADAAVRIPLVPGMRSLNVATAAATVLGEALRQTGGLPAA